MRLFIAEKPSIANDIVKALGGKFERKDGYYESAHDVVTWCFGHILKNVEPEAYDPSYKKWNLEDLPLKLYPVKQEPIKDKEKQVKIVLGLIKKATLIVHAGDPDDEGQLLIDEVLIYGQNSKPVKRLLINDNTESAVKKSLTNLKDNHEFKGLYHKALARSVGDDIFGKSMTRAFTITAQLKGYQGKPLSVGRVQTPILGLICRRWMENQSHKQSFYYPIKGTFDHKGKPFNALWKVNENAPQDDKKRLIDENYAKQLIERLRSKTGSIISATVDDKQTAPPLPFNLVKLQQYMNKKHKMTAAKTLEITQQLREKYKAITYNRSDCSYLSEEQYSEAPQVLKALKAISLFSNLETNHDLKSKAFDSSKVTAHTAIIPTSHTPDLKQLSEDEKKVYLAITAYYLVQFLPNKRYQEASVLIKLEDELFSCRATKTVDNGFTAFLSGNDDSEDDPAQDNSQFDILTTLQAGETVLCTRLDYEAKKTTPPALFTEASLLAALVRVADFVIDPRIKALLKAKDKHKKDEHGGIGTPATRHSMIEKLKEREFITLEKDKLIPTQKGLGFYHSLPLVATNPDMTAYWSEKQEQIEQGKMTVDTFVHDLYEDIKKLLAADIASTLQISASKTNDTALDTNCPNCNKSVLEKAKLFVCENQCGFKVWKEQRGKTLTKNQAETLIKKGKVSLKGFVSKAGKKYDGILVLEDKSIGKLGFEFENK